MKNTLSIAISLASAAMLTASTIEWDLPNISGRDAWSDSYSDGDTISDIVFLLVDNASSLTYGSDGSITGGYTNPGGTSTIYDVDDDQVSAVYSDSQTGNDLTYVMAFYDNGKYYAISDGNNGILTVSDVDNSGSADPLLPNSGSNASSSTLSGVTTLGGNGSSSASPYTPSSPVPEPATAALALAGVAMLLRRRKA